MRNRVEGVRPAFLRWYVRTHKKLSKRLLHNFVIKSKMSTQVGFWRFKMMALPMKLSKKQRIHQYTRLIELLEIIEKKSLPTHYRRFFYNCSSMLAKGVASHQVKVLAKFTDVLDSIMINKVNDLKWDSFVLNSSTIMKKLARNLMGKAIQAMQALKANNLRRKMEERLSKENMNRLLERMTKIQEGTICSLKRQGYEKFMKFWAFIQKQKGTCRRIVDSNTRLMGMGYNKLIEEWKARQANLKEKLKFVIKSLTDKDARGKIMAYNAMKQRKQMLNGVGLGQKEMLKQKFLKMIVDKGFSMQIMGVQALVDFLKSERNQKELDRLELERQQKEKDRLLRRIMDSGIRLLGQALRQLQLWAEYAAEVERARMAKQRGIMRRIVDSNVRLMEMGYNKLIEEWKARQNNLKEKMKFVIKALTDKDAMFIIQAYGGLKANILAMNGVGMGDAQMKKVQLIKR